MSMKGGTNVGGLSIMLIAVALIFFSSVAFFDGMVRNYEPTFDNSTLQTKFQNLTELNDKMNTYSSNVSTGSKSMTNIISQSGDVVASFVNAAIAAPSAILSTLSLILDTAGYIQAIVSEVATVLHVPAIAIDLIMFAVAISVAYIFVSAILRYNIKDDTR